MIAHSTGVSEFDIASARSTDTRVLVVPNHFRTTTIIIQKAKVILNPTMSEAPFLAATTGGRRPIDYYLKTA